MNEANWTFEICYRLRNEGIPFELEKGLPAGRVDIAITKGDIMYGVIECKRQQIAYLSKQFKRYASMGIPFHHSYPSDDLSKLIDKCKLWIACNGRSIQDISSCSNVIRRSKRIRFPKLEQEWDADLNIKG